MARDSGIWWWKARNCYFTWIKGKRKKLDPDIRKAKRMWAELVVRNEDPSGEMLVSNLINTYLDWSESNHTNCTHKRIRASLLSFGRSLPAGLRIHKLLPFHLTMWLDDRYPKQPKNGLKPATDNTRHNIASDVLGAFNWAVKQRMIPSSPLQGYTKPPKTPRTLYLSPEQMEDLLSHIEDQEFRDLLIVMLRTGCRPQEVRALEAKYVLFKEREARIPKELAKGRKKERRVPLDDVVLGILKRYAIKYPEGPLLRNTRGQPWTKDAINSRFHRIKNKVSYRATAYAMRHTFINEALRNGASETAIAEVVGHEDKTMILKVYGHANLHNDLLQETVRKANRRAVRT